MKKRKIYIGFMIVFAFFILLNFAIHAYRTNQFNNRIHTISGEGEQGDYTFTFTPQNGSDVSWTRTANVGDRIIDLNACSFEGVFKNQSEIEVSDWTLRLDISEDCYVNAAWCGLVEIHQFVSSGEKVQKLDLRNIDKSKVNLTFYEDGDIFLFPLMEGDYLVYYPNEEAKELSFAATANGPGQVGIGIIFYWDSNETFCKPDLTVEYQTHKRYLQGREAVICAIASFIWIMMLVAGIAVRISYSMMLKKAEIENSKRDIERKTSERMLDELIKALASSIDAKDAYTHGHSERVAQYALKLAQKLNLSNEECKEVFYAGLVHDVGKIAISENIINKTGRLTDEEFEVIKSHPARGEKILTKIEDMPYLALGAKYHHERYDGKGYPSKAMGEEIPLLARIIAVADSYDAMTSQRSYRNTLDQKIVKQEIWKGIGTQFDPLVAKHMISMIDADVDYDMREKIDEKYEIINEITTNEFWENYDPKSIKSEDKIMSDTSIKYFAEFICTVDTWCNPIKLSSIGTEETQVRFTSKTNEDAQYIWNVPAVILYTSEDGEPVGKNYKELAVFMCAGYSWKTGITCSEECSLYRKEAFGDWNNWLTKNKEGLEYTVSAKREKNIITLNVENDMLLVSCKAVLPEDFDGNTYICVAGENSSVELV